MRRWIYLAGLMLAGESIYMLPYMRKTFQTSMEAYFGIGSTEIGLLNSMFGVLALLCYFPSGWVADRFSARTLLSFSLMATGIGGLFLLSEPSYPWLFVVHAFWGITSILTFWSALIKATRFWGDAQEQGMGFGLLEGGRGVVAAALATVATVTFAHQSGPEAGLVGVILIYSISPILAALVIWGVIPNSLDPAHTRAHSRGHPGHRAATGAGTSSVRDICKWPAVWRLAVLVFFAYFLYLGTYELPAFAENAYGKSKTFGATLGTVRDWLRPIAAVGAGLLADRISASRTVAAAFVVLATAYAALAIGSPAGTGLGLLWTQVGLVALAAFALRGIYFALLEEMGLPRLSTGTVVGIVSFIGFMPDMFAHLLAGWFVDTFEGAMGYRYYFALLSGIAVAGLGVTLNPFFRAVSGRRSLSEP